MHFAAPDRLLRATDQAHRRYRSHRPENLHILQRSGADDVYAVLYEKLKNKQGWAVQTLPCTHFVQIDMPNELTALLLQAVA